MNISINLLILNARKAKAIAEEIVKIQKAASP